MLYEMNAEHLNLLYYTWVCWLSKASVLKVFELQEELNRQGKCELESCFRNSNFMSKLTYLVDIFDQLNHLNLKLQRRDTTILDFIDALNVFVEKLENWRRKAKKGDFAVFETLSSVIKDTLDINVSSEILQRLFNLRKEFLTYCHEIFAVDLELVRKHFAMAIEKVTDDLQDELIDFRNDSTCKDMFATLSICEFWARVCFSYPRIGKECIKVLLPFSSTYLCEVEFFSLVAMKTKARNRLDVENGICCALASSPPNIAVLVNKV